MSSRRRSITLFIALCAIGVLTVRSAAAAPTLAGSTVKRGHTADGRLNFIGSATNPLELPPGTAASLLPGRGNAGTFVTLYGPAFGLKDPVNEVQFNREDSWADGRSTNRYQQVYQGVPVFGGDIVVNMDADGRLMAMAGKVSPKLAVDTTPGVSAEDATATAMQLLTAAYGAGFTGVLTEPAALWIYDESLFTESAASPSLVWKVVISGLPAYPVREIVLVNAQTGSVELHFNQIDTRWRAGRGAEQPRDYVSAPMEFVVGPSINIVRSAGFASKGYESWAAATPVCDQTDTTSCNDLSPDDRDATLGYLYASNTWRFFNDKHGYDYVASVTGGAGIKSLINIGGARGTSGWYQNAFWDGEKLNYGDGFAEAEDVVGHEMTHGFTQNTSGLLYLFQSGAINESLSDMWGEFVDQTNTNVFGTEHDAPINKWYLGEDLPGIGAIRNMANPPMYGDPDKMTSGYYYRGPNDNGGVHTNSGVNNKAAYLMAQGGTFNGFTVNAMGIDKTASIYFLAETKYLFPGADYVDLSYALDMACEEKYGYLGCKDEHTATLAVQMTTRPATISTGAVVDCPTGTVYGTTLFSDSFESVTSPTDNWVLAAQDDSGYSITPSWQIVYYGFSNAGENKDLRALYAGGLSYMGLYGQESATMANPVVLPAANTVNLPVGGQIHFAFEHTYLFDNWNTEKYDGGVVEYSTDNGGTWADLRPRFSAGQNYNGVVFTGWNNPLSGRSAFVANSLGGKVFTRYNLSPLAGQNVKVRFRIGYDYIFDWGWFIDRVDVHTCVLAPKTPLLLAPASGALVYDYTPTFTWAVAPQADQYWVQIFSDAKMYHLVDQATVVGVTQYTTLASLDPNTTYYWRACSIGDHDKISYSPWSALRSFRTALTTPTQIAPTDGFVTMTDRPTFSWTASTGATNYLWQVCRNITCTVIVTQGYATATQATPLADLPVNATLYWRVLANGVNRSAWSSIWSFTTGNPPSIPLLLTPAANLLTLDTTPTFTWMKSLPAPITLVDPLDPVGGYIIEIATDALFTAVVHGPITTAASVNPSYTVPAGLPNGRTYYWHVRSVSVGLEMSGWSAPRALRIGYAAPTGLTPADLSTPASKIVVFDWDNVTGQTNPTSYTIQVSLSNTFTPLVASATVVPSTYTRTFTQASTTKLYWRVRANGGYGPGDWSTPYSFTLP